MQLYHTSPAPIHAIHDHGLFGEFLFFSSRVHVTTAKEYWTYSIEIDKSEIICARSIFYQENYAVLDSLVREFAERFSLDIDTAEEIISEREQLPAEKWTAEAGWEVQLVTARAAKLLGFRAAKVTDEQEASYMIDMYRRESELKLVSNR